MDSRSQYTWLVAEVDYSKHFLDGKEHWYPAVGWISLKQAQSEQPNEKFRAVEPPRLLTQSLLDDLTSEGCVGVPR